MWRLWLAAGSLVWLATLAASGVINYLAGSAFGRTEHEAIVYGTLGVAADAWKAVGPIFIVSLWRDGRRVAAGLAMIVWVACFTFAVTAAIGLAAHNRSGTVGSREATRISYHDITQELADLDARRAALTETRSPEEIERTIDVVLSRPVAGRGTVATLSRACAIDTRHTREACAKVAELRAGIAQAREVRRLDDRRRELRQQASLLRERNGLVASDPQAELISRLSFGRLAVDDVGLALILLLVAMVELISAFAPVVLHEFAVAMRARRDAAGRALSRRIEPDAEPTAMLQPVPDVFEYLAERIVPDAGGHVALASIVLDFIEWCGVRHLVVPPTDAFVAELNRICDHELAGKVQRRHHVYFGFRLRSAAAQLAATG